MDNYLKTCTKCGVEKAVVMFAKNNRLKSGYASDCKDCRNNYRLNWDNSNREHRRTLTQKWRNDNRSHVNLTCQQYRKTYLNHIISTMRSRIHSAIKNASYSKKQSTICALGIDYKKYCEYLSNKFVNGMTLENYGSVWHIDHIIPLASAKSEQELIKLLHYTNTQPLFAKDNLSKGAKLDW
jgi:hypothetical protein